MPDLPVLPVQAAQPAQPALHAYPLALLAGLAAACGFAPLGLWPLTLAGLALLAALVARAGGVARAALVGWWFGVGHFTLGNNWIATAFTYQAAMPAWLGWVAVVLLALYLALFPALATAAAWALARASGGPLAPLLAATWIAGEWLRATVFTGFAWDPIGVAAVDAGVAPLAARWAGTYGLSGLVLLLAAALPAAWRAARDRALPPLGRTLRVALPLAALATALVPLPAPAPADGPRLRIVQPNVSQADKWVEGAEERNFRRLARLTGPPGPAPRLVLWPEVAIPWYLEEDAAARAAIAGLLGPRDLLLTGGIAARHDAAGSMVAATNSLFLMDARGRLRGRYDKAHLVPYGEYLPMRPLLSRLGLSRLAPGDMDFDAGPGPRDLALPGIGAVGGQICYEMIFSGDVVDRAHRPRFLFNPSNDAWFGAWGPPQHLAQARMRAIEEGLPIVRATPTGISAVIDADGRVRAALPWRTAGAIDARLPPTHAATAFARAGNALPLGLAALLIAVGLLVRRGFASGRRRR